MADLVLHWALAATCGAIAVIFWVVMFICAVNAAINYFPFLDYAWRLWRKERRK